MSRLLGLLVLFLCLGTVRSQTYCFHTSTVCPSDYWTWQGGSLVYCCRCESGAGYVGVRECAWCPVGTYNPDPSLIACQDCPAGKYSAYERSKRCSFCSNGRVTGVATGGTQCTICEAGTYADSSKTTCTSCETGKFLSLRESSGPCDFCGTGLWTQGNTGASVCSPCVAELGQTYLSALQPGGICVGCPENTEFVQVWGYDGEHVGLRSSSTCRPCTHGKVRALGSPDGCVCPDGQKFIGNFCQQVCPHGHEPDMSTLFCRSLNTQGNFDLEWHVGFYEPGPSFKPTTRTCSDYLQNRNWCTETGNIADEFGVTANIACCGCGGGLQWVEQCTACNSGYSTAVDIALPSGITCETCPAGRWSNPGASDERIVVSDSTTCRGYSGACYMCCPGSEKVQKTVQVNPDALRLAHVWHDVDFAINGFYDATQKWSCGFVEVFHPRHGEWGKLCMRKDGATRAVSRLLGKATCSGVASGFSPETTLRVDNVRSVTGPSGPEERNGLETSFADLNRGVLSSHITLVELTAAEQHTASAHSFAQWEGEKKTRKRPDNFDDIRTYVYADEDVDGSTDIWQSAYTWYPTQPRVNYHDVYCPVSKPLYFDAAGTQLAQLDLTDYGRVALRRRTGEPCYYFSPYDQQSWGCMVAVTQCLEGNNFDCPDGDEVPFDNDAVYRDIEARDDSDDIVAAFWVELDNSGQRIASPGSRALGETFSSANCSMVEVERPLNVGCDDLDGLTYVASCCLGLTAFTDKNRNSNDTASAPDLAAEPAPVPAYQFASCEQCPPREFSTCEANSYTTDVEYDVPQRATSGYFAYEQSSGSWYDNYNDVVEIMMGGVDYYLYIWQNCIRRIRADAMPGASGEVGDAFIGGTSCSEPGQVESGKGVPMSGFADRFSYPWRLEKSTDESKLYVLSTGYTTIYQNNADYAMTVHEVDLASETISLILTMDQTKDNMGGGYGMWFDTALYSRHCVDYLIITAMERPCMYSLNLSTYEYLPMDECLGSNTSGQNTKHPDGGGISGSRYTTSVAVDNANDRIFVMACPSVDYYRYGCQIQLVSWSTNGTSTFSAFLKSSDTANENQNSLIWQSGNLAVSSKRNELYWSSRYHVQSNADLNGEIDYDTSSEGGYGYVKKLDMSKCTHSTDCTNVALANVSSTTTPVSYVTFKNSTGTVMTETTKLVKRIRVSRDDSVLFVLEGYTQTSYGAYAGALGTFSYTEPGCVACPTGTFRRREDPTCRPQFADAGVCPDTYAEVDLGLDTSDANRPVARWGDTNATRLRAVLAEAASNCSCVPGSVVRYVPILGLGENDTAPSDACAHPTRFLACAQRQRASTLPFWEPVLTYASPTEGNITRVRMCVPTLRAGPNPETDDFAAYTDTPGFRGVQPEAVPSWSADIVRATPARAVDTEEVYVPRAVFPRHRGLLVEACQTGADTVTVVAAEVAPAAVAVYAPGVFLHVGVFSSARDLLACEETCHANWECLWFSYANTDDSKRCALGIGAASVALPHVHACEGDLVCLQQNVFLPFAFKVDTSAAVYVWEPALSLVVGTVCAVGRRACLPGSVRKLDTHGLCEECGRDRRRSIDLPYTCEVCPAETPARTPNTPECQKCTPAQFIDPTTETCRPCAVNHQRDATNKSACIPCPLGEHRAPGDAECRACPPGYGGHYDRDALGCARCSGPAGARCPCPAGWATDTSGAGGCTPCPPGSAKSNIGHGACVLCRAGLVAPQHGAAACVPCARDRGPGITTRTDCLPAPGYDAMLATRPDTCPPGYEAVPLYTTCMPCGRGWFKNTTGPGPCSPCPAQIRDAVYNATHCASAPGCAVAWGEVRDAAPLAMLHPDIVPPVVGTFAVCVEDNTTVDPSTCECRAGHWRKSTSTCAPCAPGTFKNTLGDAETCAACPRGFFQSEAGQDFCTPCPTGTYDPNPDPAVDRSKEEATCQACPANATTTIVAAHACACKHRYTDWDNTLGECMCKAGYVRREAADYGGNGSGTVCFACDPGMFRNSSMPETADGCTACAVGHYAASAASTSCTSCPYGTWAKDPKTESCTECESPGTIFDPETGYCSITCAVDKYAKHSTSCEECPVFTYSYSGSIVCTACGAHATRTAHAQSEGCECEDVGWNSVAWDNHSIGYPKVCVSPDNQCPNSARHERVVAWRLDAGGVPNATGGHGCPREAFDIDFMPHSVDPATHRARYQGTHPESGETWSLAWNQTLGTYTIQRGSGDVVAYFSAFGYEHVLWVDTPTNRVDRALFWNCRGETVNVRPVVECMACSPGQYFAHSMTMSRHPDQTQSQDCRDRAAYFEGPYVFHGEWFESTGAAETGHLFSTVYRHNALDLDFILNAYETESSEVRPLLRIRGVEHYINFAIGSASPITGDYDTPGFSVNVSLGPNEFNMVHLLNTIEVNRGECSETLNFEITFHSGCLFCDTSDCCQVIEVGDDNTDDCAPCVISSTNEQLGWRFGGEDSRELFWEQEIYSMGRPVYLASISSQKILALTYMEITGLGYATYAIIDNASVCLKAPTQTMCTLADIEAFYNMSHAGSRRVNITQVYGDSEGLGHWQGRSTPVKLARCTGYKCPRGMSVPYNAPDPRYRLDCITNDDDF